MGDCNLQRQLVPDPCGTLATVETMSAMKRGSYAGSRLLGREGNYSAVALSNILNRVRIHCLH
jgi:hypothetical protein